MTPVGEENYFFRVIVYPHIILRENKLIATAGADRLQEGMRKAFGKPIGLAARIEIGSVIFELHVKAENLEKGKEALRAAMAKLPMKYSITVTEVPKVVSSQTGSV